LERAAKDQIGKNGQNQAEKIGLGQIAAENRPFL